MKAPVVTVAIPTFDRPTLLREALESVLRQDLKVMDSTAISLCMDNGMPIVVFNMNQFGNIKRVVMGERVGSMVRPA